MRECNSCGKCCIKYGNGRLSASLEDIDIWSSFMPEVSNYVSNGKIWVDPNTEELLSKCPWLRLEEGQTQYTCAIYQNRPEDCRAYPANVADMVADECEMIEDIDLLDLQKAERARSKLVDF